MKKKIAAVALVLTLAVAGIASARGGGMGGGMGPGMNNCPQGQMYQQLDKATQDKVDAFQKDTQALRKQIVMKHAEMRALMGSQTPDQAAVAKVSGELFDLQACHAGQGQGRRSRCLYRRTLRRHGYGYGHGSRHDGRPWWLRHDGRQLTLVPDLRGTSSPPRALRAALPSEGLFFWKSIVDQKANLG